MGWEGDYPNSINVLHNVAVGINFEWFAAAHIESYEDGRPDPIGTAPNCSKGKTCCSS